MDQEKTKLNIFWFRRDLRLHDNAALYHALKSGLPVLPLFIFDTAILSKLEDRDDARLTFIHRSLADLNQALRQQRSSILVKHGYPLKTWEDLTTNYAIQAVYTNHDYEPYALQRDMEIKNLLESKNIEFHSFKDQVIFEKNEVLKSDSKPYTVFTPFKNKWLEKLKPFFLKSYPNEKYLGNLFPTETLPIPTLKQLGFSESSLNFPGKNYQPIIADYAQTRDFPGIKGTSHIGVHLRFGTLSIREVARAAFAASEKTWLNELAWRDFYAMILFHFPETVNHAFRKEYDRIAWLNNELEFEAWCQGKTGYPLVDAGMRELNTTGFMHNRVRMVCASFLCKHLLVDWRWGERYFARKLLDFDLASNVGGWQWAAGCGTDAAPYFRIFNPELQMKKFDPQLTYVKKWVPEYADFGHYPPPIVDHAFARERCLKVFKQALQP